MTLINRTKLNDKIYGEMFGDETDEMIFTLIDKDGEFLEAQINTF